MAKNAIKLSRNWGFPNARTFEIPCIARWLRPFVAGVANDRILNPFAGWSDFGITNDLDPERPAMHHMKALDFLQAMRGIYDLLLWDPPYSATQCKQLYGNLGIKYTAEDARSHLGPERVEIDRLMAPLGAIISFGWNSNGLMYHTAGRGKPAEQGLWYVDEVMLVAHGNVRNDTICTVERRERE